MQIDWIDFRKENERCHIEIKNSTQCERNPAGVRLQNRGIK